MPSDASEAAALYKRAERLGYKIEPSQDGKGYCLWRVWPGSGQQMVLGISGGVTLNIINWKLSEIAEKERAKKGGPARV